MVIRTRLNGRVPLCETASIEESGPESLFDEAHARCRAVEPNWPGMNCGMFMVDNELGQFEVSEINHRENTGVLLPADRCWGRVLFFPSGVTRRTARKVGGVRGGAFVVRISDRSGTTDRNRRG
ncbi:hypothetical protein GCM10027294_07520 [Marinactinospora endophytica]